MDIKSQINSKEMAVASLQNKKQNQLQQQQENPFTIYTLARRLVSKVYMNYKSLNVKKG